MLPERAAGTVVDPVNHANRWIHWAQGRSSTTRSLAPIRKSPKVSLAVRRNHSRPSWRPISERRLTATLCHRPDVVNRWLWRGQLRQGLRSDLPNRRNALPKRLASASPNRAMAWRVSLSPGPRGRSGRLPNCAAPQCRPRPLPAIARCDLLRDHLSCNVFGYAIRPWHRYGLAFDACRTASRRCFA